MSGRTVKVVRITEEHIESYREAVDKVMKERRFLARLEAPPIESARDFVRGNIRDNAPHYVAVEGERVIGWCDISLNRKPVFAHAGNLGIGIVKEYRGRGIGTELMAKAIAHAKEIGLEKIELDVYESNRAAIRLYKKFGFKAEGKRIKSAKIDGRYENLIPMGLLIDQG
jgi:RimJ/RimL family protein N-acetyltransferase